MTERKIKDQKLIMMNVQRGQHAQCEEATEIDTAWIKRGNSLHSSLKSTGLPLMTEEAEEVKEGEKEEVEEVKGVVKEEVEEVKEVAEEAELVMIKEKKLK